MRRFEFYDSKSSSPQEELQGICTDSESEREREDEGRESRKSVLVLLQHLQFDLSEGRDGTGGCE